MSVHGRVDFHGWRSTMGLRHGPSEAVNPRELRRWAAWLRVNEYRQIRGTLRKIGPDGMLLVCAIGALEEVSESELLFSSTREDRFMRHVVVMNDCLQWTFGQIATWLELIADGVLGLAEALQVRDPDDLPPHEPTALERGLTGAAGRPEPRLDRV